MPETNLIKLRQPAREELRALTESYLAAGRNITQLSHVERAQYKSISEDAGFNRRAESRRELQKLEQQIAEQGRALAVVGLTSAQALRQMRRSNHQVARLRITGTRLEQLAAQHGYAFRCGGD
jgi:hypothetical protein